VTTRKPARMTFPDWVEAQIRAAEDAGAFENLPGKGKPIPGLARPRDDMAWIANKLRSENVDIADVLPPSLALAREVERLPERVARLRSESQVRELVDDLNARIHQAHLAPQVGPPMRVGRVDIEQVVTDWRTARATMHTPGPPPAPQPQPQPQRRRLGRRRNRP
jgi:hypothetical protein